MSETDPESTEIALFPINAHSLAVRVDGDHQTIWATQSQIAEMFDCTSENVRQHLKAVYESEELSREATTKNFLVVRSEGGRDVSRAIDHFNLDVILAIGYRVNSGKATKFRQWATQTLSTYIRKGFVIDERRLSEDENAQRELAKVIRALRTQEKVMYETVKEIFKASSSDYDSKSDTARTFFATATDKFHFAASQKTAAQIRMERSNAKKPHAGLTTFKGDEPTVQEALIAKNYLNDEELITLENLCQQWMLYAEGKAMRGQKMTMGELLQRINQLLEFNGYPVMWEYPRGSNPTAAEVHVKKQMTEYKASLASKTPKQLPPKK